MNAAAHDNQESRPRKWSVFLNSADEWLVSYSLPPVSLSTVRLFSLGQAVELYLKAAYAKLTGSVREAERKGHNIKALWDGCKALSKDFMPDYEIREAVWNADMFGAGWQEAWAGLSVEDLDHFERNRDLYFIAKQNYLPNLKYFWATDRSSKYPVAIWFLDRNVYWIGFFRELRTFLEIPTDRNFLKHILNNNLDPLPRVSADYLRQLFE